MEPVDGLIPHPPPSKTPSLPTPIRYRPPAMLILGINAYHGDSSAAILRDGELLAAVEEERFNRVKHWAGFPAESIRHCLQAAHAAPDDLDHIALSFNPGAHLLRKAAFVLRHRPGFDTVLARIKRQGRALGLRERFAAACGTDPDAVRAILHSVEHHDGHCAAGFLVSPFDEAAILSVDGMGDFVSCVLASGNGTGIRPLRRVFHPHSIGFLYAAITLYLGFPQYGDEYKVMGLAPYGEPEFLDLFRKIILPHGDTFRLNLEYFTHHTRGMKLSWDGGSPVVEPFHSPLLEKELGPPREPRSEVTPRHQNIARSLQAVTEEILFHCARRLHDLHPSPRLVITGGVAMNSVANGKFTEHTPFREVYIPCGAADNGLAFGAAFHVWNRVLGKPRVFELRHGFWGPEHSPETCEAAARGRGLNPVRLDPAALIREVIALITTGHVVGWFQGRSEFGARALGNRSLLADPRRTDMRDIINLKIKFREKFRPFAPSILREHVSHWFEIDAPSPFMEKVFRIRPGKRAEIPAVTHVDGTGRLQSVDRESNPLYYDLIDAFRKDTGVPILLNTSLNENEPIVNRPEEALDCMLRTRMDALAVGPFLVKRPPA